MSLSHLRSRLHRRKYRGADGKPGPVYDDQFYDVSDGDVGSLGESVSSQFSTDTEKQVYEQQLALIQEQLVSAMIENQNLAQELKQRTENESNDKLTEQLNSEKKRNILLQDQLMIRSRATVQTNTSAEQRRVGGTTAQSQPHAEVLPAESQSAQTRSRLDKFWDRTVDAMYDVLEDFNDITRPEEAKEESVEPLSVKTLKENIKRFKAAIKPITDTAKGLQNLVTWKSRSYTLIVLLIYMYSVWNGWFLPLMFFLGALRMVVNLLHFKGNKFQFAYLDPGEPGKETDEILGLSEKFNLVLLVATKVQNGLGSAADSLERVKNLLTWKHLQGSKCVLTILCVGFLATAVMPTSFLWKFIGIGFGIKIFFINYIYNRYPRIKKRYDSNHRLWQTLPTDIEYNQLYVKAEMNKYIVVPRTDSELERTYDGQESSSSSDDDSDDSAEFRQVFSLPVTECPLRGWLQGKRTVLVGKDRSLITLLSKKRGKLFLTNSFLCFEREKCPSTKNIVIPLQDIVSIDKVKINQRMPGKGMTVQIMVRTEGKENILLFGGIIGREDVVKNIDQAVRRIQHEIRTSPSHHRRDSISRRVSSGSTSSRIQNFTFGAYYEDSD